jgi:hypothetical protein
MNPETTYRAPHTVRGRDKISRLFLTLICCTGLPCAVYAQTHAGNVINGEARLEILQRDTGTTTLPKPASVVIEDLADQGPVVESRSLLGASHFHPETPEQLIQQIQASFAKTLAAQFKKVHVETERASEASASSRPVIVIRGELTSIAPGNSRQRIIVGFGRGASDLKAHITIAELVEGQEIILLECNVNSQSGKQPGAILSTSGTGFAVGVATGHFGDKLSSTVQADASRMAKLIARQTEAIMLSRQWICKSSAARMDGNGSTADGTKFEKNVC